MASVAPSVGTDYAGFCAALAIIVLWGAYSNAPKSCPLVLIGKDTRISGYMLGEHSNQAFLIPPALDVLLL